MNPGIGRSSAVDSLKDGPAGGSPQGSNEWLAAVFTASRDGIVVETNERIVEVNDAGVRLLGYANTSELVGRPVSILCSSPGEKQLPELGHKRSNDGLPELFMLAARRKDGTQIQLEATAKTAALDGNSHRIIILRDIPPRTNFEAQKLEAVQQLIHGAAHDLNNLLTAIRCQTELVLVYETVPPTVRERLQKVITATDRATNLTRQLRAFSRRQPMQLTTVDLNALIGNLTKMLRRSMGDGIELRLDSASKLPQIHADPSMVEQVILELAVNAREAMPQGGILTLATAVFQADGDYLRRQPAARSGEFVMLTVSDTGCGIAPELLRRIFEPSFTTKAAGKGNGLGLASVLDIVQQQQGWLDVESRAGQGTCFRICLPARRDLASTSDRFSQKPYAIGGNETLLLVADDRELRKLIRLTLQKLGYQVLDAASEIETLRLWGDHASDIRVVLTDMLMPEGSSGCDLIKRLRAEKPELKAIVMSGCAVEMPEADLNLLQGVRFLSKPFDPVSLAHMIRSSLDETHGPAGGG